MNKNMVLAILLSSAVYILWFGFISLPNQKVQQGVYKQTESSKQQIFSNVSSEDESTKVNLAVGKKNVPKSQLIQIETEKAAFYINPIETSIDDIIYRGPVTKINLSISKDSSFIRTLSDLEWKKINSNPLSIEFNASLSKEIKVKKIFSFSKEPGINEMILEFKNLSNKKFSIPSFPIELGPGLGTAESEMKENPNICQADYTYKQEGRKHPSLSKIKDLVQKDDWIWAGLNNRYFLFAVFNEDVFNAMEAQKKEIEGKKYPFLILKTKTFEIAPGETKKLRLPFYAGAKDYELLKKLGAGLDRSVDFGFFSPIAKMANSSLKFFYSKTGNYGLAIILLSVAIQILIFPLGIRSYRAMSIMKKLQPEMKALQEKYKDDPKRMNMELMELYRKYGANPLSGCWPMLLQLPIFFALYTALRNSWDLHGAHFALWINDLSAKDPYYALPIFMGALMLLQQHLSPQVGTDPAQAKMMKWMPLIFVFMFLSLPSGLVIYWIVNSVFSIAQTLYLKQNESK